MRKIIVQEFMTIDGYGAQRNDGMQFHIDYSAQDNKQLIKDSKQFLTNVDTMLLGARTYKFFTQYWPEATAVTDQLAPVINKLDKYVVSTKLQSAPWGNWDPATIINEDIYQTIADLKQKDGKDIVVWGSLSLAQSLLAEHLVDEVCLRIIPTTLGDGKPLFIDTRNFKLIDVSSHDAGLVTVRYKPL